MPSAEQRPDKPRDLFEWTLVLLAGLGAFVFIEPAPVDVLIVLLLPLAVLLRRAAIPPGSGFALACVGLFVLGNLLSLPAADDLGVALRFFAITAYLIMAWALMLGVSGSLGERAMRMIMLGWAFGAVLTLIPSIATYFGLLPFSERLAPKGRMHGLFKDANVLGAWLVAPTIWSVARLVSLQRGGRLPWLIVLLTCGIGILLTYSRGAWISLGTGLFVFFCLRLVAFGSARARLMTLLVVPFAALLLAVAIDRLTEVATVKDMLEIRLGPQHYDVDRFATQREALDVATQNPLGIGPGQSERTFTRAAHNAYVRGFVENGYLGGLALALLMLGSLLRSARLAIDARDPALQTAMAVVAGALAAICIESLVIDSVHWRHMWVLCGLAWTPVRSVRASSS